MVSDCPSTISVYVPSVNSTHWLDWSLGHALTVTVGINPLRTRCQSGPGSLRPSIVVLTLASHGVRSGQCYVNRLQNAFSCDINCRPRHGQRSAFLGVHPMR
jgi:hypothetical protein